MTHDGLIVDVYPGDGHKDWTAFVGAGLPWVGAIFKASQGLRYRYDTWLARERAMFVRACLDAGRYGIDAFDGFYHYLTLDQDGAAQAEYFMRVMDNAGGEKSGTLWGMVDVERGGQLIQNPSRSLVEDRVRGFADRYHQLSGRTATLYGGELLRSVGITGRLGCGRSAIALYGPRLPASIVTLTGTDLAHLMLWQYTAAEGPASGPDGYAREAPGCGRVDISALVLPGGVAALPSQLWAERPAS